MLLKWTFIKHPETYERKLSLLQPFSTTTNLTRNHSGLISHTKSQCQELNTALYLPHMHNLLGNTEALGETHSRFSLKTQKEDGLFQKHVRVGAPLCPLAAQRNQPPGSEAGLYRLPARLLFLAPPTISFHNYTVKQASALCRRQTGWCRWSRTGYEPPQSASGFF